MTPTPEPAEAPAIPTPRTREVYTQNVFSIMALSRMTQHAETLETELAIARAEIDRLTKERDEARKDSERLDWAEENPTSQLVDGIHINWTGNRNLREAISAAMKGDA